MIERDEGKNIKKPKIYRCKSCGRRLKSQKSILRGYGEVCFKRRHSNKIKKLI